MMKVLRKFGFVFFVLFGFVFGVSLFVLCEPRQATAVLPAAKPVYLNSRSFRVDFEGKCCEFCGCNKARFFEFSARADGAVFSQYLCSGCREFLRYK